MAAFYLIDTIKLYKKDDILISEDCRLHYQFNFPAIPFTVAGKTLFITRFWNPWGFDFRFKWLLDSTNWDVLDARDQIRDWSKSLLTVRMIGAGAALNLFLLGPMLTALLGFRVAAATAIAEHMILLVLLAFELRSNASLRLGGRAIAAMLFEFALCPGYLPNICKRLSLARTSAPVDGCVFFALCGDPGRFAELQDVLRIRLQDVAVTVEAHSVEHETAMAYKARLGV